MSKKNLYLFGGIALLGGAAYLAFKKGVFGKKVVTPEDMKAKQVEDAKQAAAIAAGTEAKKAATSITNPDSMKAKISYIQSWLGVSPDGIVGPNTLKALAAKYPQVMSWNDSTLSSLYDKLKSYNNGTTDSMLNWTGSSNTGVYYKNSF